MKPQIFSCLAPASDPPAPPLVRRQRLAEGPAYDLNRVQVLPGGDRSEPQPYDGGDSFMVVLAGELHLVVDAEWYTLAAGQVAVIPKGAARGFRAGADGATFVAGHVHG